MKNMIFLKDKITKISITIIIAAAILYISYNKYSNNAINDQETINFKIVEIMDYSYIDYNRSLYRVVTDSKINPNEAEYLVRKILKSLAEKERHSKEISLFIYHSKFAKNKFLSNWIINATWSINKQPNPESTFGEIDILDKNQKITVELSNRYFNNQKMIDYNIDKNLEKRVNEIKRIEIFKEIEAIEKFATITEQNTAKKREVRKKYNITKKEQNIIVLEGVFKGW